MVPSGSTPVEASEKQPEAAEADADFDDEKNAPFGEVREDKSAEKAGPPKDV